MSNYHLVEGEWADGKYMFRKIQPEDWDAVVEHFKNYFLRDEPTSKLLGYTDAFGDEMGEVLKIMLADDLSFLVEETATGEVAALRVTYRHTPKTNFDGVDLKTHQSKVLMRMCEVTDNMAGLFDRFDVEEYPEFFVASCATNHRRQGIISEMYARNLKFLKAEGFKIAKSLFTSPYTRAAAEKLGFVEVCRIDFRDLLTPEGEPAFNPDDLTEESFAAIMVKRLDELEDENE